MIKQEIDGKERLRILAREGEMRGGLYVGFCYKRDVSLIGWIDELTLNEKDKVVILSLSKFKNVGNGERRKSIVIPIGADHTVNLFEHPRIKEHHFAPQNQEHFNLFGLRDLIAPEMSGSMEGLEFYLKRAMCFELLTRE